MEVEIRAKISNPEEIEKKLKDKGARYLKEVALYDEYFGAIELYQKIGYSFVVRIRKSNNDYFLAVKSAKQKIDGCWEEYELAIENPRIYREMFQTMGLENIINIEKTRREYKLDNLNVVIDKFKEYGNFLEVEIITEKPDKSILFDFLEQIDIQNQDIVEKGYISLFLEQMGSPFAKYIKN